MRTGGQPVNLLEFRRILRQTLLLPVLLLLILAAFVLWQIVHSSQTFRALDQSDQITAQIVETQKLIIDQETGLRGYQLTGNPAMLEPYRQAAAQIPQHFAALSALLPARPNQRQRLASLRDRYQIWLDFAEATLAKHPGALTDPASDERGKALMDDVRAIGAAMLDAEARARRNRSGSIMAAQKQEFLTILAASLVVGLFLGLFTRNRLTSVSRTYNGALEELRRRSDELYMGRQRLMTTLESIGDAVIACDNEGRIQFMNVIAQNLTGWTGAEAINQPLQDVFCIVNEETREIAENPVEKVRRLDHVIGLANHTALISRQGKEYVIDDSAAPIRDADGKMNGIVLVFRDVTEQKRTQAALVAGEKLAVAGRLAASIAHEIHNPLDSVANLLFLLATETEPATRAEYLQLAQQELGRTMQISRTMLSLYREPKAPIMVDLKEVIEGVLLLLDRRLAQQGIEVQRAFSEPLVVEGFPAELRQVFTNVIVNALEAAGANGRIRIRIDKSPAEELRSAGALVEIADSGPGVPDSDAHNLFQPFYTTKGDQGTGLGLWVSMGIVQKHGGTIQIVNGTDNHLPGAHVRVYLPTRTLADAARRVTAHVGGEVVS
jgi:PAS domain S-box-containing protein